MGNGGSVRCRIDFTACIAWMKRAVQDDTAVEIQDSVAVDTAAFEAVEGFSHSVGKVTNDLGLRMKIVEYRIREGGLMLDDVEGWMARSDRSRKTK